MSGADTAPDAVAFLRGIAGELAEIHRGSDYSLWRGEAKHRLDQYLSRACSATSIAKGTPGSLKVEQVG
ncbi:hypothetical protein [Sinorhizobium alkalisoli]|uniref:Uncharacterized protein n=1 Tax=Sinorhizobium alkalisoli TaxID=1752398 RepID=A0A1E3V930_9HYPH|nr:hypothetical protein [Sinorhizobium alkalisoli]ODR90049.1 hypothetical protein A8M32_17960 [Sinorhizobium alkalisoli]